MEHNTEWGYQFVIARMKEKGNVIYNFGETRRNHFRCVQFDEPNDSFIVWYNDDTVQTIHPTNIKDLWIPTLLDLVLMDD